MKKKYIIISVFISSLFAASFVTFFPAVGYTKTMFLKDADNKVDPVNGEPITRKRFNTSFNGKRYWFSSFQTLKEFKQNPAKYAEGLDRLESRTGTTTDRAPAKTSKTETARQSPPASQPASDEKGKEKTSWYNW